MVCALHYFFVINITENNLSCKFLKFEQNAIQIKNYKNYFYLIYIKEALKRSQKLKTKIFAYIKKDCLGDCLCETYCCNFVRK